MGYFVLGGGLLVWVAFAAFAFMKKWSATVAVGGGFIIACISLFPLSMLAPNSASTAQATAPPSVAITYAANLQPAQRAAAEAAVAIFRDRCPALFTTYAADIRHIKVDVLDVTGFTQDEDYGWKQKITVTARVKDSNETRVIPNSWRAWGHNLFFDLGAGNRPGIDVGKEAAARICGFGEQRNTFVDEPRLRGVL